MLPCNVLRDIIWTREEQRDQNTERKKVIEWVLRSKRITDNLWIVNIRRRIHSTASSTVRVSVTKSSVLFHHFLSTSVYLLRSCCWYRSLEIIGFIFLFSFKSLSIHIRIGSLLFFPFSSIRSSQFDWSDTISIDFYFSSSVIRWCHRKTRQKHFEKSTPFFRCDQLWYKCDDGVNWKLTRESEEEEEE